ncbi:methylated-DNA--[protein]-cysteine S-methyltransferase [Desulfofalx alkaliphila]|uniref:methylated-DNA--[protein]-cysteine S-methyltransferase n=1 Tax=Desulfofalx alkaliphila TaxID=105483 RepID=UPI0004E167EA|nr:methylated-DNA--[protein]-cysteine S-methyltransferase [Desulfofalx alkaliphila]
MKSYILAISEGWIGVAWSDKGLWALTLPYKEPHGAEQRLLQLTPNANITENYAGHPDTVSLTRQLEGYFNKESASFNFQVDLSWCTDFQRRVLTTVAGIPYGETRSYSQVAEMIGRPKAARAVGNALSSNRALLVIPCHRVIRADGSPGGFGSLPRWKEKLLDLEK